MTAGIVFVQDTVSVRNPHTEMVVTIHAGDAWWASDPFVVARPELFGPMPPKIRGEVAAPVEQASRAPGEKRQVKRG